MNDMMRFSLSGLILVFDAVHTTAAMMNVTNAIVIGVTTVAAVLGALPEISRWANAFVTGETPSEAGSD
jgi:hypothetical protein